MQQINGDQYIETGKLNMTESEIKLALQEEGINTIRNILDKQYIKETDITNEEINLRQNNYKEKGNYTENVTYNINIKKMLGRNIKENIKIVLVNAEINNKDFNIIIKLDQINHTYSVFLEDYIQKYNYTEDMKKEEITINNDSIETNGYNSYINMEITESYIVSQYFSEYKTKMLNDPKEAYHLLDIEYSQKKYGNYEKFKNYVENNKQKIKSANIKKYQMNEHNGIKEYVCVDTNDKYYIFIEETVAQYKVVLDTYTIDLPSFLSKYKTEHNQIKVGMNIQKIFEAINDGDYGYVYNKLDNTFKSNYFKTQADFEKYVKQNFANNQLEYKDCTKSGDLYIYNVIITDGTESNKNAIEKTFIMKLNEGTDFVMSFDVK